MDGEKMKAITRRKKYGSLYTTCDPLEEEMKENQ